MDISFLARSPPSAYAFSRVIIEPLIGTAVNYEGEREHAEAQLAGGGHDDGHELFTRAIQENVGAAVGVIAFGIAMGVLFAAAYTVIRGVLNRRGFRPNPAGLALLLAGGMFVAIALAPGLKYPANPPTIGLQDTIAARSSAFLTITVLSVVAAAVAVAVGLAWARRWGIWRATAAAMGGYAVVILIAMAFLPSFQGARSDCGPEWASARRLSGRGARRVPGLLVGQPGVMWLVIGATSAAVAATTRRHTRGGVDALT